MESKTPIKFYSPFSILVLNGVFLFFDRFLKWRALKFPGSVALLRKNIGWQPFFNKGIAFGIRLPTAFTIAFSVLIIITVIFLLRQELRQKNYKALLGLSLILSGALSNLADRVVLQETVDYFRIFLSVVNIADGLIIAGFVIYFASLNKE